MLRAKNEPVKTNPPSNHLQLTTLTLSLEPEHVNAPPGRQSRLRFLTTLTTLVHHLRRRGSRRSGSRPRTAHPRHPVLGTRHHEPVPGSSPHGRRLLVHQVRRRTRTIRRRGIARGVRRGSWSGSRNRRRGGRREAPSSQLGHLLVKGDVVLLDEGLAATPR